TSEPSTLYGVPAMRRPKNAAASHSRTDGSWSHPSGMRMSRSWIHASQNTWSATTLHATWPYGIVPVGGSTVLERSVASSRSSAVDCSNVASVSVGVSWADRCTQDRGVVLGLNSPRFSAAHDGKPVDI